MTCDFFEHSKKRNRLFESTIELQNVLFKIYCIFQQSNLSFKCNLFLQIEKWPRKYFKSFKKGNIYIRMCIHIFWYLFKIFSKILAILGCFEADLEKLFSYLIPVLLGNLQYTFFRSNGNFRTCRQIWRTLLQKNNRNALPSFKLLQVR